MLHCKKCKWVKNDDDFYACNRTKCKECVKKAVKANRESKVDYYKAYDRSRANLPHRVAAREAYQKTEKGKASSDAAKRRYAKRNPIKRAAHTAFRNAKRDGLIVAKPCVVCGDPATQGHHEDYSKPLDVVWLCTFHHALRHKILRGTYDRQVA